MKKFIFWLALLCLVFLPQITHAYDFVVGEKFTYTVKYLGIPIADASLEIVEIVTLDSVDCYHFVAKFTAKKLVQMDVVIHSYADTVNLISYKFSKKIVEVYKGEDKETTINILFDQDNQTAFYSKETRTEKAIVLQDSIVKILPETRDYLATLYFLRSVEELEVGKRFSTNSLAEDKMKAYELKAVVEGIEDIAGVIQLARIKFLTDKTGLFKMKNIKLWVTCDEARIPIKLDEKKISIVLKRE